MDSRVRVEAAVVGTLLGAGPLGLHCAVAAGPVAVDVCCALTALRSSVRADTAILLRRGRNAALPGRDGS